MKKFSVKVYALDISDMPFDEGLIPLVERARAEKILSSGNAEYKRRSLYAGILLRHALFTEGEVFHGAIEMRYGDRGKPYVKGSDKFFGITHSGDLVFVATAACEVGIDAEVPQNKDYSQFIKKTLSETEREEYRLSKDKTSFFLEKWVIKESYLKLLGTGLEAYPSRIDARELEKEINFSFRRFDINGKVCFFCVAARGGFTVDFKVVNGLKTA